MDKHNTVKLQVFAVLTLGVWLFTLKPVLGIDLNTSPIEHLTDSEFDITPPSPHITQETSAVPDVSSTPEPTVEPQVAVYTANKQSSPAPESINHTAVEVVLADAKTQKSAMPPEEVRSLIIKYSQEYGVSAARMLKIAECESGLNPDAVNGSFGGIFQFLASTWESNRRAMGLDDDPALRFNAEESIRTAAFKMSRDGFGAWPVCSTM